MASFLHLISAIRQPDNAIYSAGREITRGYQRIYAAAAERRRDVHLPGRLSNETIRIFLQSPERLFFSIHSLLPDSQSGELLSQSEDVLAHRFDLLGSGPVELRPEIDWYVDPISGYRWADKFAGDLSTDGDHDADIERVWELSRFKYLPALAVAFRESSDPRFQLEAQRLITDWIEQNPVYSGPNWISPKDAAIRACNWLYWWRLLQTASERVDAVFVRRFLASLMTHGRYIVRNLERRPACTNNHYIANLAGLAYLGLLLPPTDETQDWAIFARKELEKQVWRQFLSDGVSIEASIPYHRFVLELFVYPALLYRANGVDMSYEFWKQIERAMEFVAAYLPENGLAPQIGDNNSGRLHAFPRPFGREVNDHRYLLDIAASLYPDNPILSASRGQSHEAGMIISSPSVPEGRDIPVQLCASCAFAESGIYVLRSATVHCLVDCGTTGKNGAGRHAHNDSLSFTLTVAGERIIVDSGTGTYAHTNKIRNLFRSTAMHNTVRIAGIEINDLPRSSHSQLPSQDRPKVLSWSSDHTADRLAACHYGYTKLTPSIVHMRTVSLDKVAGRISVADRFLGNGAHTAEWHIPLDPLANVRVADLRRVLVEIEKVAVEIVLDWDPDHLDILRTQYSESYGSIKPNATIHILMNSTSDRVYSWEVGQVPR